MNTPRQPRSHATDDPHEGSHEKSTTNKHGSSSDLVTQIESKDGTSEAHTGIGTADQERALDTQLLQERHEIGRLERVSLRLLQCLDADCDERAVPVRSLEAVEKAASLVRLLLFRVGLLHETQFQPDLFGASGPVAHEFKGFQCFLVSVLGEEPAR